MDSERKKYTDTTTRARQSSFAEQRRGFFFDVFTDIFSSLFFFSPAPSGRRADTHYERTLWSVCVKNGPRVKHAYTQYIYMYVYNVVLNCSEIWVNSANALVEKIEIRPQTDKSAGIPVTFRRAFFFKIDFTVCVQRDFFIRWNQKSWRTSS